MYCTMYYFMLSCVVKTLFLKKKKKNFHSACKKFINYWNFYKISKNILYQLKRISIDIICTFFTSYYSHLFVFLNCLILDESVGHFYSDSYSWCHVDFLSLRVIFSVTKDVQ